MAVLDMLDKEHTIARPGFNRWLVPPAALAIHLCIGMAYGFSVFWLPLSKAIGIKESIACPADMGFLAEITATTCDWKISMLGWMFTLFFVFLGLASARCSAAGSNTPVRARPAWSRPCAGAAAWSSRRSASTCTRSG